MLKNPFVVFGLLLAAAIGGGYYIYTTFMAPELARIAVETTRKDALTVQLGAAKDAQRRAGELEKQMTGIKAELDSLKSSMPIESEMGRLIGNLNRVALESNLKITKTDPQLGSTDRGFYQEQVIKMTVIGGYHEIANYFDKIGKFRRIITIRNVNMKRSSSGASLSGRKISADFDASSYLQKPLAPVTPDAAGKPA